MTKSRDAQKEFDLGNKHSDNSDFSKALKHYKESTELDGKDPRYWIGLGSCLIELRHWDEAEKALKQGIDLKPAYSEDFARIKLAEALMNNGKKEEAFKQWEYVTTMEPCYPNHEWPMEEARKRMEEYK